MNGTQRIYPKGASVTTMSSASTHSPKVWVGTCGFSYKDWIGPVYSPKTKPAGMLELYSSRLPVVEIDSTYYRVPSLATFASMARRTPKDFRFTAKLPGTGTHLASLSRFVHDDVRLFRTNIQPLIDARKFACALAQFPNSFRRSEASREYLVALHATLSDIPLVVEFRNREWQTNDTLELLRHINVGLVNVDQPRFKSLLRASSDVTSGIAYVRFHGRNYQTWWKGTNESRYDYLYSADELGEWADRLVDISANPDFKEVFAFFNNHRRGQAVRNAEALEAMLEERFPAGTVGRA
jgi:uncharacterized protein YecE (DUF72 family)